MTDRDSNLFCCLLRHHFKGETKRKKNEEKQIILTSTRHSTSRIPGIAGAAIRPRGIITKSLGMTVMSICCTLVDI